MKVILNKENQMEKEQNTNLIEEEIFENKFYEEKIQSSMSMIIYKKFFFLFKIIDKNTFAIFVIYIFKYY